MRVFITFDTEMWTNGWDSLDSKFQSSFERYYIGRSAAGDYALPKTLEILRANGLVGVFFVEPLFSARFGAEHLRTVTKMLSDADQDIQLHLHTEWVDEVRPALLHDVSRKRQHLTHYNPSEQVELIAAGKRLLEDATGREVKAFRAGSFAANASTFKALAANGIFVDSSLNAAYDYTEGSISTFADHASVQVLDGVASYRVTVFRDGFGRRRPAHINACSFVEMRSALEDAVRGGVQNFVIVSHNFEMLKPGSNRPDSLVVARFERLCRYLSERPELYQVGAFPSHPPVTPAESAEPLPKAKAWSTAVRHAEQAYRLLA